MDFKTVWIMQIFQTIQKLWTFKALKFGVQNGHYFTQKSRTNSQEFYGTKKKINKIKIKQKINKKQNVLFIFKAVFKIKIKILPTCIKKFTTVCSITKFCHQK